MAFTFHLKDDPEFQEVLKLCKDLKKEVADLRSQLPEWVGEREAQRLTNLSARTLYRLRIEQELVWKHDHGIHYQRASLLAHNAKRAIGRGRYAHLLIVQ